MIDKLIQKYRERVFSLDFKEIKLTQLGLEEGKIFTGPGYLEQNQDGTLNYKLFNNSGIGISELFGRFKGLKAGELIPINYYYSLEGIDIYGRKWTSERINIDFHNSGDFTVIQEKIKKISTSLTLPSSNGKEHYGEFHQVWIPKKIKLPSNLSTSIKHFIGEDEMKSSFSHSAAEYENDFTSILLFHDDDWLIIQIKVKENDFHPFIFERVLSALQYILAEPLNWVIYEKRIKDEFTTTLRPFQDVHKKSKFRESILLVDGNESKVWELFDTYLNHILLNKEDFNDPITNIVSKSLSASQGSYDAFSLSLSLAVEEILNVSFKDIEVEKSVKEEDIQTFKKAIKSLDIEDSFRGRIGNFIGYIQNTTATDRLRKLIDTTPISKDDYDNWKAIRSYFAHPDDSELDTQDKIDKTYSVLTLLHKLIFLKIGYEGSYNNFGEKSWPLKEWKPKKAN